LLAALCVIFAESVELRHHETWFIIRTAWRAHQSGFSDLRNSRSFSSKLAIRQAYVGSIGLAMLR
jgi:hypothetical protein